MRAQDVVRAAPIFDPQPHHPRDDVVIPNSVVRARNDVAIPNSVVRNDVVCARNGVGDVRALQVRRMLDGHASVRAVGKRERR